MNLKLILPSYNLLPLAAIAKAAYVLLSYNIAAYIIIWKPRSDSTTYFFTFFTAEKYKSGWNRSLMPISFHMRIANTVFHKS